MIYQSIRPHIFPSLVVFFLLSISSYSFRPNAEIGDIFFGVIFLVIAYYLLGRPRVVFRPLSFQSYSADKTKRIRKLWLGTGLFSLVILTEINAHLLNISFLANTPMHIQLLLLLSGSLGLYRGLGARQLVLSQWQRKSLIPIWLFCIAFGLRFWELGTLVSVPVADEYSWAGAAMAIHDTDNFPILAPFDIGYAFPWVYPYLIANSFWLFGKSVTTLRLISVIFGALTVPATYWLGRELLGPRIGLWSALLLATFPPHIHLSRLGLNNVADPLFGILCLLFVVRAWRYNDDDDWLRAGIALGGTQLFYEGGRLLYPTLVGLVIISLWLHRRGRLPIWRIALPFLALSAPIYLTFITSGYSIAPRLAWVAPANDRYETIIATTEDRNLLPQNDLLRFIGVLGHFVHRLDNSYEFYGGPQPMILTIAQPFFLLGLGVLLWHHYHFSARLILLWVALTIIGISLIKIGAWTARYVVIFPAICFIMAIGIQEFCGRIIQRRFNLILIGTTLCFLLCCVQIVYYFGPHLTLYQQQIRPHRDYADAYQRALDYPSDTQIYFLTEDLVWMPYLNVIGALAEKSSPVAVYTPQQADETWLAGLSPTRGHIFLVPYGDWELINRILRYHPVAGPYLSPYRVPTDRQYMLLYAPPK